MKQYDIVYVGAGPATIFSLLKLLEGKNNLKIAVLEKGKGLENRPRTEVCYGFAGAGAYSDCKLVNNIEVGGNLDRIVSEEDFNTYADEVLRSIQPFSEELIKWTEPHTFDCGKTSLTFLQSKVCHVGTDRGTVLFKKIEDYLKTKVDLYFDTEVENIVETKPSGYNVYFGNNFFHTNKVVLATGPRDFLLGKLIEKLGLKTTPNKVQMGIRVEVDNSDGRFDKIIKANYDFKFVKKFPKGRVRTFCANSGAAYIAEEKNDGMFTSYNGHAFKDPAKANKKVNFGIMCEFEEGLDKNTQIQICKNINHFFSNNPYDLKDFKKFMDTVRFSAQSYSEPYDILYPKEMVEYIDAFITELSQVVSLEGAKFYIPEIKLRAPVLKVDRTLQVYPNLFLAGDVVISRSIVQAGISGILVAEELMKKDEIKK